MLVGREGELRLVEQVLAEARACRSGTIAFVGEPGAGKSALLTHADEHATGMSVLRARGVQSEARIPFAGLSELLRPALGALERIPGPQASALEVALALRPPRAEDRFAVGAATLSLLAAHAEHAPLLVLVDDLHWIDGSSAAALLFALRRLHADPIAAVLSVRAGEPSLLDGTDLRRVLVPGLDRAAVGELLRRHGATAMTEDVIDRIHRETGGNALAVVELAGQVDRLSDPLPIDTPIAVLTSVSDGYVQQSRLLPWPARVMVQLAAAYDTGDLTVLTRAARALGVDPTALAAAEHRGLVRLTGDRIEFRHPLIRSAIYGDTSPEERRRAHRALAGALPDVEADRRAWHLALAALGPDEAASSALEQAGVRARERSAYDVASRAFERAARLSAEEVDRARLLHAAADASWLGGLAARAVSLLDEIDLLDPTAQLVVAASHLRGHITTRLGPVSDGYRLLLSGAERAMVVDPDRAVVMLAEAVNASFYAGDTAVMRTASDRIGALARDTRSPRTVFLATIAQGMAATFAGDAQVGAELLRDAVRLAEDLEETASDPWLLTWAAMGPLWLREAEAGRALIERAVDVARRRSAIGVLPYLLGHIAIDHMATERWAEAAAGFHEVISLARESQQRTDLASALARLAWLEARQGAEEASRQHAAEALATSRALGLGLCEVWSLAALGELEMAGGRSEAAIACFDRQRELLQARAIEDADLYPEPELVELLLRVGAPLRAAALASEYRQRATAKGQPWALGRAARSTALVASTEDFEGHFDEALELHARTPDRFEAARTELAFGARLRRERQRVRARTHLRRALESFETLGSAPWAEMARAELAATGETARRRDVTTQTQLTPQELQIALLLGSGHTTRDAASRLFVSPKTIEYHLRSIYRKLEINSRDELAKAMAE